MEFTYYLSISLLFRGGFLSQQIKKKCILVVCPIKECALNYSFTY